LAHFSFFCIQNIADINKNIIARAMTMGIVNLKKIDAEKKKGKRFLVLFEAHVLFFHFSQKSSPVEQIYQGISSTVLE
jgi:hypothetical protein